MQGQTKSTNPSLFDSIFNFVCPSGLEKLNGMEGGVCVEEEELAQIGYGEFLDDHLTEAILAEYMTEAGIVKHTFQLS